MRSLVNWGLGFAIGLLLVLASCKLPQDPVFEQVSQFKPHGKSSGGEAGITLGLDLRNPNPYKIKLIAYDLEISVNGHQVGSAARHEKQILQKNGVSTIYLEMKTDLRDILSGLLGALSGLIGGDPTVEVGAKGTVVARAKGIQKSVPIDFKKQYSLKQ